MTHPLSKVPEIATDPTFTSGPDAGQPVRVAASAAEQKQGMIGGNRYPASKFNYQLGVISDHVRHLAEIQLRTFVPQLVPTALYPTTTDLGRPVAYTFGASDVPELGLLGSDGGVAVFIRTRGRGELKGLTSHPGTGGMKVSAANADGSRIVLAGNDGAGVTYSSDHGDTWTFAASHHGGAYKDICFSDGFFYATRATLTPTTVGKSADGSSWAATAANPTANTKSIIRAGKIGGLPAVLTIDSTNTAYYSLDGGVSWTSSSGAIFASGSVADVQWNEDAGLWMAVSLLMGVAVSTDGHNWTQVRAPSSPPHNIQSLACSGGAWVVTGDNTAAEGSFLAYSVDNGETWKAESVSEDFCASYVVHGAADDTFWATFNASGGLILLRSLRVGTGGISF